jgi:hypothetical protein
MAANEAVQLGLVVDADIVAQPLVWTVSTHAVMRDVVRGHSLLGVA